MISPKKNINLKQSLSPAYIELQQANFRNQGLEYTTNLRRVKSSELLLRKHEKTFKKLTIDEFVDNTSGIIKHFYESDPMNYTNQVLKFFEKAKDKFRIKVSERLNKLIYLQPTLKCKNFRQISGQIIKDWKKNPILHGINLIWFNILLKFKFENIQQFENYLQIHINTISQICYQLYHSFFDNLQKHDFDTIKSLKNETARIIITDCIEWKDIHKLIIIPLVHKKIKRIKISLPLDKLNINDYTFNKNDDLALINTRKLIKLLTQQISVQKIMNILTQIRKFLLNQLMEYQNLLISQGILKNNKILEKDDLIDCLVYCIVKDQLREIIITLEYLKVLIGANFEHTSTMKQNLVILSDLKVAAQYTFHINYQIKNDELSAELNL